MNHRTLPSLAPFRGRGIQGEGEPGAGGSDSEVKSGCSRIPLTPAPSPPKGARGELVQSSHSNLPEIGRGCGRAWSWPPTEPGHEEYGATELFVLFGKKGGGGSPPLCPPRRNILRSAGATRG
jgi:hypothetical protein